MAFEFVKRMEGLLDLFIAIHNRRPTSSEEFVQWVAFYKANSRTTNSRGSFTNLLSK